MSLVFDLAVFFLLAWLTTQVVYLRHRVADLESSEVRDGR